MAERPDGKRTLAGRLGRVAARLDKMLSDVLPRRAGGAAGRAGEWSRKRLMSGHWQDYAFMIFVALIVLAVAFFALRACGTVSFP